MSEAAKVDAIVERYIQLREQKTELKRRYEENVADIDAAMERIEAHMLAMLQTLGVESVKTRFGTPYISKQTSVTVADRPSFFAWLQETGEWELADIRAAKTPVIGWKDAREGDLPPGLNYRESLTVNIKKS